MINELKMVIPVRAIIISDKFFTVIYMYIVHANNNKVVNKLVKE